MFKTDRHIQTLGGAIPPADRHAVSVCLPTWRDVVGYEEGEARVHDVLKNGYPRFFVHHAVRQLCASYNDFAANEAIWVFPSRAVAEECVRYAGAGRVREIGDNAALVLGPQEFDASVKEFWQHTGLLVSSRRAEDIIAGRHMDSDVPRQQLKQLVAPLYGAEACDVYLYPSGIAAIFRAWQAVTQWRGKKTLQLGFPYLDTLKIQQKFGEGVYCAYDKPDDLDAVETLVRQGGIAAVFCEVPGNPLLRTIDLERLSSLLRLRDVPLVIDDTLGTPFDIDIRCYADVIATSLTKFFSGKCNAMGGSLVLNPQSPHHKEFKKLLDAGEELLYGADAEILFANARGFAPRMKAINANAERLADYLGRHPLIQDVFYTQGDSAYEAIRKPGGGYGGLLSFTLKDKTAMPQLYDRLPFAKGPSLGTELTLLCPYTLLAHYNELAWAEEQGVSRHLLRVSVGAEKADEIIVGFETALAKLQTKPNGSK